MKRVRAIIRRNQRWPALLLVGVALAAPGLRAQAAELTIQDWLIAAQVHTSPFGSTDTADSGQPESPYQQTHYASVPPSFASSTYDILYAQTFGRFLIESNQTVSTGPWYPYVSTRVAGTIWFTTDAPLALWYEQSFAYNLPPVSMNVTMSFFVYDLAGPLVPVAGDWAADHSFTGEGASGTLARTGSAILPGGHSYRLTYIMDLVKGGGPNNGLGTADGHLNFTLDVLPEPATATLILCALPLLRHRRRR